MIDNDNIDHTLIFYYTIHIFLVVQDDDVPLFLMLIMYDFSLVVLRLVHLINDELHYKLDILEHHQVVERSRKRQGNYLV